MLDEDSASQKQGSGREAANEELYISDLDVYASGQFVVELSKSKKVSATNRVPVKASVNKETGEVKLSIDKDLIERLA